MTFLATILASLTRPPAAQPKARPYDVPIAAKATRPAPVRPATPIRFLGFELLGREHRVIRHEGRVVGVGYRIDPRPFMEDHR
jgi:hypothetical protein